jgi:DNA-binding MarR family transcriptional regulator
MVKKKINLENFLLQEKPVRALLFLKRTSDLTYLANLSKDIDSTYAHTWGIISKLQNLGFVRFEKVGRIKLLKLTDQGTEVANAVEFLVDTLGLSELWRDAEKLIEKKVRGKKLQEIDAKTKKRLSTLKKKVAQISEDKGELTQQLAKKLVGLIEEAGKA